MRAGIICDLNFEKHIGLKNYYYAIKNIFKDLVIINTYKDLNGIDILFIGNEHFQPHRSIWEDKYFINYCNNLDIKVVIFSVEKIFNSKFPYNEEIQKNVQLFENLYQFALDVDDVDILGCNHISGCMSKQFLNAEKYEKKINKCAFLGNTNCFSYSERANTIKQIEKYVEIEFLQKKDTWEEYFKEISKYRFVLSPLGNANCLNLRFYEILLAKSIPIQQVKNNTLKYFDVEKNFEDCIFFEHPYEISEKIKNMTLESSTNNIYLENHITDLLKEKKIL